MDVSQVAVSQPTTTMAIAQLKAIGEAQMAVAQNLAESQAQMATIMQSFGIGQHIDTSA
jgi:hypothetical protein